jgi:phosphatidylglycerol lysyltransferase
MGSKTLGRSVAISRSAVARHAGRGALSLWILGLCLALLSQRLTGFDLTQMQQSFVSVSAGQWVLALCAVGVSYLAMGQYDVLILRHLGSPQPEAQVRRAGIAALAISQTVGLGLLSGALVRWRMLPDLRFGDALRITFAVSLSFLAAAAVVLAAMVLAVGGPGRDWSLGALAAACLFLVLCLWRPRIGPWRWPNLFTLLGMVALTTIDVTAAAMALWVLLPGAGVEELALLPAFLLALLTGMVAGTPGGLGPFDLVLLHQFPTMDPEALLAAIMACRLVYFAIPSGLAIVVLAKGGAPKSTAAPPPQMSNPLTGIDWPEAGLLRQGELSALTFAPGRAMVVGRTGHALIALGHVGSRDGPPALAALRRAARAEGRLPALYKIPARFAGLARQSGMWVIRIGAEAVINPGSFSLSVPNRAGLRRKLRKASAAGVSVAVCEAPLPTGLHRIAQGWAARQGGERGFSMGRFCPEYLSHQRVYVARQNGEEIAFISLHVTDRVWTLDLIRHDGPLPDGTIHLLVTRAIEDAGLIGVAEVNLAAVPIGAFKGAPGYLRVLARWGGRHRPVPVQSLLRTPVASTLYGNPACRRGVARRPWADACHSAARACPRHLFKRRPLISGINILQEMRLPSVPPHGI